MVSMNIRRSRRRQISQIWINLLATFFFPKFFIKFSRVTNRHLARINLLLVENFGNSSPSVFMIFLFFFVDFLLKICLVSSPSPNSPSKTRDCTWKSNGRLRVQKFVQKFVKFPPHRPKPHLSCRSCDKSAKSYPAGDHSRQNRQTK